MVLHRGAARVNWRLAASGVDSNLLLLGSAASIPGAMLGSRLTGRLSERQPPTAIGFALLIVGAATAARGPFST